MIIRENWQETHKRTYSFCKNVDAFFINVVVEKHCNKKVRPGV